MWPQWTAKVIAFLSLHYPKARFLQYSLHCGICSSSRLFKLDRFHPVPSCSSSFYLHNLQIILSPNRPLLSLSLSLSLSLATVGLPLTPTQSLCSLVQLCFLVLRRRSILLPLGSLFFWKLMSILFFQAVKMYKSKCYVCAVITCELIFIFIRTNCEFDQNVSFSHQKVPT